MRATEYLAFIVIVGLIAGFLVLGANEFNNAYPESGTQISTENITDNYDKIENINTGVNKSIENFKKLGDDEGSWFTGLVGGLYAIPYAIIQLPILIIDGVSVMTDFISNALGVYIPAWAVLVILALLFIDILRRFLEFFGKARV